MMNLTEILNTFKDNGERPIVGKYFEEVPECFTFAYKFSTKYIKNKTVLDYGCGGGYGTEFLSRYTTKSVTGFDIDSNTIKGNSTFFKAKKLNFTPDIKSLKKYDVITCFQVIEHVKTKEHSKFITNLYKLLNPNGILIIATPNQKVTSTGLKKPIMVFHEYEFTQSSLVTLLNHVFKSTKIYGQLSSNYKNVSTQIGYKVTRIISQIEIVRFISRHLPMFIKLIFMNFGSKKIANVETYSLVSSRHLIDKSLVLISISRK